MSKAWVLLFGVFALCSMAAGSFSPPNVVWDSPSKDATGSMPIGNGEVAANVWADPDGVLHFYISRSDSWSEICRLLKLGEVEVKLTPNPFGSDFEQKLVTQDGVIQFKGKGVTLKLFVDSDQPVIWITGTSKEPMAVSARLVCWRTQPHTLSGNELVSAWTMKGAPFALTEAADHIQNEKQDQIVYHRNPSSIVDFTMKHQGMQDFENLVGDPLLHRTFGAILTTEGGTADSDGWLTAKPSKNFAVKVATDCQITPSGDAFVRDLRKIGQSSTSPEQAQNRTTAWWHQFWNRSWISVTAPAGTDQKTIDECAKMTQAYALQRFMLACASRGNYPLKFNGSLFTVEPKWAGMDYDPDYRKWGDGYWWQNTRLPYWAMVACGDFSEMEPLFHMYESFLPICEARAQFYYHAKGTYFPETISFFGMYSNGDYGWDRKPNQPASEFEADWWKYAYNQGLELVQMMLDRYHSSPSPEFLKTELLPMAKQVLLYFDTRFPRDKNGLLKLTPDQVVETYWHGVINDTPCIAGLHAVLPQLLKLPGLSSQEMASWQHLYSILPPVTVKDGRIMPAQEFDPERTNVENAEFYAIWPFNDFGVMEGSAYIAAKTFEERFEKANTGWQYDGQTAALAGLTDEAKKSLLVKIRNSNSHFRFPAMWGPNYDWLPDQTHGGNIMLTMQSMILQTNPFTGKVSVGTAWPKDWNVNFKLYSRAGTIVEGTITDGKAHFSETPVGQKSS